MFAGESWGFCAGGVCQGAAQPCPCQVFCLCCRRGAEPRSLCRPGPALLICARSTSRRHVRFGESLPAASRSARLLLAAAPAEGSPASTAFPSATWHTAVPGTSQPGGCCAQWPPILATAPLCIHLPHCLPWRYTCPQKPSAQPVSLGWAWRDAHLPSCTGSGQVQPNQSHPWGLLPTCGAHLLGCPCGGCSGCAGAVLAANAMPLPARSRPPF